MKIPFKTEEFDLINQNNIENISKKSKYNILNMNIDDDFIGIFDTDFDGTEIINYFNNVKKSNNNFLNSHYNPRNSVSLKKNSLDLEDECVYVGTSTQKYDSFNILVGTEVLNSYNEIIAKCYVEYIKKFNILCSIRGFQCTVNIQKTEPGGGYHHWHSEVMNLHSTSRYIVSMLYLNDVVEGGETEFLYQHRRVDPKRSRVVIWPSQWTHTHRGNPPLKGTKYIATSWIHFSN